MKKIPLPKNITIQDIAVSCINQNIMMVDAVGIEKSFFMKRARYYREKVGLTPTASWLAVYDEALEDTNGYRCDPS